MASRTATTRLGHLIRQSLRRHDGQVGNGPLVLAVSGGADSMALLLAAAHARHALRRDLVVAHFSHGIRRTAERGEARLVRRSAALLGVPYVHEQAHLGGDEASAREARYAFLARTARERGAAVVLTAHTQDDQAETLLLRLARGTGLHGAGAIREFSERLVDGYSLTLLRPLLNATRSDTEAVCAEWSITPASDGTNRSLRYARNRVRQRVLADLQAINPDVRAALAGFAAEAQDDDEVLQQAAVEAIAGAEVIHDGYVEWATSALSTLPHALRARILQRAWGLLRDAGEVLSRRQLDSIDAVLASGAGSVNLGHGYTCVVEQQRTTLRKSESYASMPAVRIPIPGSAHFGEWEITAALREIGEHSDGRRVAVLDADALGGDVCIRGRLRGDRVQPLGLANEVRLQDVLVNAKVPRLERDGWPLFVTPRGIAWVCGIRIAEWAKVTQATKRHVTIEAIRAR